VRREAAHFAAVSRSNDLPSPSIFGLDCEKKKKKKKKVQLKKPKNYCQTKKRKKKNGKEN
jgi:hypothetical protein